MVTYIENVPIKKKLRSVRFLCKTSGKLIFRPIFSNQEMLLCTQDTKGKSSNFLPTFTVDRWASHKNIISNFKRNFLEQQVPKSNFRSKLPRLPCMFPIAGQCTFICQCHQPNLYVNEIGLLPRMGKLK